MYNHNYSTDNRSVALGTSAGSVAGCPMPSGAFLSAAFVGFRSAPHAIALDFAPNTLRC